MSATAAAVKLPAAKVPQPQQTNGSSSALAKPISGTEATQKSLKVVKPSAAAAGPIRKQASPPPVRKVTNGTSTRHDPNHAKRSHSPEPRTSSSSASASEEDSTESGSSSATPAVSGAAPEPPPKVEPPATFKGSGPNGELTLKDIPVSGISFQEVIDPNHQGPPVTKVIIYKPKSGKGQLTAKVIVTKVFARTCLYFVCSSML